MAGFSSAPAPWTREFHRSHDKRGRGIISSRPTGHLATSAAPARVSIPQRVCGVSQNSPQRHQAVWRAEGALPSPLSSQSPLVPVPRNHSRPGSSAGQLLLPLICCAGGGDGTGGDSGPGSGSGGSGDGHGGGEGGSDDSGTDDSGKNRSEALAALAAAGKSLESLPTDLRQALEAGRITGAIVRRWEQVQASPLLGPLLGLQGFKERLLADDLFITKVGIECGVGICTKTAAEISKRKDKFFQEMDFVIADVIMALIADFMLTWLPAPTVNLSSRLAATVNPVSRFLAACPDNAFQVAIRGTSFSLLQRVGAIVRNGGKLFVVGTCSSLFGTLATNGLKALRSGPGPGTVEQKPQGAAAEAEVEVPVVQTSLAYGVYMAVSSNIRYQIVAGVLEQRILEPLLENNKLALSALSFLFRTGNTFLGSLLWVDYARIVGVQ